MRRSISSAGGGGGSTAQTIATGSARRATLSRVILHNGSVRTGDPRLPLARALAIAGDRIGGGVDVREGDRSLVSNERVDLDGRCVVPGFTDAHVHFLEWSLSLGRLDLSATRSQAEVLAAAASARAGRRRLADRRGLALGALAGGRPAAAPRRAGRRLRRSPGAALGARPPHGLALVGGARAAARRQRAGRRARRRRRADRRAARDRRLGCRRGDPAAAPSTSSTRPWRSGLREAHARGVTGIHDFQREHGLAVWQRLNAERRLVAARLGLAAGRAPRRDRRARAAQRARRRVAAHRPGQGVRGRHARLAHGLDARAVRRRRARRVAARAPTS